MRGQVYFFLFLLGRSVFSVRRWVPAIRPAPAGLALNEMRQSPSPLSSDRLRGWKVDCLPTSPHRWWDHRPGQMKATPSRRTPKAGCETLGLAGHSTTQPETPCRHPYDGRPRPSIRPVCVGAVQSRPVGVGHTHDDVRRIKASDRPTRTSVVPRIHANRADRSRPESLGQEPRDVRRHRNIRASSTPRYSAQATLTVPISFSCISVSL